MSGPDPDIIQAARRCYDALGRGSTSDIDRIARFGQSIRDAAKKEAAEVIGPFALHIDEMQFDLDNHGNELPNEHGVGWVYVTCGDFRAARRWMQKNGGGDAT